MPHITCVNHFLTSCFLLQIVKGERNKAHTQIYLMQQVLAEFSEKNKILQNESEILRNALNEKDK